MSCAGDENSLLYDAQSQQPVWYTVFMSQNNLDIARVNMVEQQIRPWNVLNQQVLDLLTVSPRQDYLPEQYRSLAYADIGVPIGNGQTAMPPKVEAHFLQALEIKPGESILEVGTGCGHLTSLLATLGKHVYSVELIPELHELAARNLSAHGITNVTLEIGDASGGWPQHEPYDVIAITGSLPILPDSFRNSLAVGGRMIAILGQSPVMAVKLMQKTGSNHWLERDLFETDVASLHNAQIPKQFAF